jgi:hypothetical protein
MDGWFKKKGASLVEMTGAHRVYAEVWGTLKRHFLTTSALQRFNPSSPLWSTLGVGRLLWMDSQQRFGRFAKLYELFTLCLQTI